MKRKLFTLLGTLGIALFAALIITVMNQFKPEVKTVEYTPPPPIVLFETVESRPAVLNVSAQGEVRPLTDITLTAQVSGKIVQTGAAFVDGGAFEKGDLLIKIEDADYRAALASAKARLAGAAQTLKLEQAEAELAARDYADLGKDGTPSDLVLRLPQLTQAKANYEAAKADVATATLNLERTSIRAPFKGRVRTRSAGLGQFITTGAQLGHVFSTDVAEINLSLSDNDLAKLGLPLAFNEAKDNPGPPVTLSAIVAGQTQTWQGRIARTAGAIDPSTRQLTAIAVVEDPYGAAAHNGAPLAAGLFVDATITGKPYDEAVTLPRSALHGRDVVFTIGDNNRLEERKVFVATSTRNTITIISGLEEGARVVTSPLRGAGNGDTVLPGTLDGATPVLSAAEKSALDALAPSNDAAAAPTPKQGEDL